jgi:hypothetical protein
MLNYQMVTHPKKSRRIPSPLPFAGASKDYENLGTGSVNREMQRAESCLGEARTWDGSCQRTCYLVARAPHIIIIYIYHITSRTIYILVGGLEHVLFVHILGLNGNHYFS